MEFQISKILKILEMEEAQFVLGFQLTTDRKQTKLWISKEAYVRKILKRFNITII